MKPIPDDLYEKIERVSDTIRKNFRLKGIVIPTRNSDGSINLGKFKVIKNSNGFYSVLDDFGETVVDQINLPQSAALIANDLALGRWINKNILDKDRNYGYAEFEEDLYKVAASKKTCKFDIYEIKLNKSTINRIKKESLRQDIFRSFEKLRKLT